jgi:hypothetical protein
MAWRLTQTPYKDAFKKSGSGTFVPEPQIEQEQKITAGLAAVCLSRPFSGRAVVVPVPGTGLAADLGAVPADAQPSQVLHLLVVARQVDHKHLALFLSRRLLHPEARR